MQNPCDKCVVQVMCTAICPPKQNYEKLLKEGYSRYGKIVMGKKKYNQHTPQSYQKMFKRYSNLLEIHRTDVVRIMTRNKSGLP